MTDIPFSELSALELEALANSSDAALSSAISEIERLRGIARDIIDLINTSSKSAVIFGNLSDEDHTNFLIEIEDVAGKYFLK